MKKRSRKESCLVGLRCSLAGPLSADILKSFLQTLGMGLIGRQLCVSQQISLQLKSSAKMIVALQLLTNNDTYCTAAPKPSSYSLLGFSVWEL